MSVMSFYFSRLKICLLCLPYLLCCESRTHRKFYSFQLDAVCACQGMFTRTRMETLYLANILQANYSYSTFQFNSSYRVPSKLYRESLSISLSSICTRRATYLLGTVCPPFPSAFWIPEIFMHLNTLKG